MPRLSKAQLAGNVVVLPTAAARQVDNYRYADQRRAGRALKDASPFNAGYLAPHDREADKLADVITAIKQTPELLILSAMLRTMEADAVAKVLEQLAPGAVAGSVAHAQAVATVKVSRLNVGRQMDLMRAFDRRDAEEA